MEVIAIQKSSLDGNKNELKEPLEMAKREDKLLPYIQIGGKIIFKQTNILTELEHNYLKNKASN
ncbi:hypothetical protein [Flavobacterium crassostreae]|uniref:Uncharacterized protein n=1 Tax=Flavobacterium crassostreae TaxID=1763534 RepID=A0A1B9DMR1_9FLAO|nr:hypothetical protein [Flavobacterium crassostreae]OCB70964.1 hypothetical protein LPBF_11915 [Flavobacterium crassostreae]